jgi:SAM-dependent methyltransferase
MIEIWRPQIEGAGESQAAYDVIYGHEGIRQLDSFYLWLLGLLDARPGSQVLDVSCGEGALVRFGRRAGLHAFGVDFSNEAIRVAGTDEGHGRFAVCDGTLLPFADETFDYVSCIGSLEHFEQPLGGMREIARVLRRGGRACILLPNTFSLLGNVDYARKTGEVWDDGQPIQRYNTRRGWERMLEASGLAVDRVVGYELPPPRTREDWFWYLRRPRKAAHYLVGRLLPLNLMNCHVFLCRSSRA